MRRNFLAGVTAGLAVAVGKTMAAPGAARPDGHRNAGAGGGSSGAALL